VLLELARSGGAKVRSGRASIEPGPHVLVRGSEIAARYVLDCSGRNRVAGPAFPLTQWSADPMSSEDFASSWPGGRSAPARPANCPTVALWAIWRKEPGFGLPDESHTLVESYENAWAWSVPL